MRVLAGSTGGGVGTAGGVAARYTHHSELGAPADRVVQQGNPMHGSLECVAACVKSVQEGGVALGRGRAQSAVPPSSEAGQVVGAALASIGRSMSVTMPPHTGSIAVNVVCV